VSFTSTSGNGHGSSTSPPVRIAAAGDMHCQPSRADEAREAFGRLAGEIDLLLLAGDLTTHGQPEQARVLADACRDIERPIVAVLGNHDWHCSQAPEIVEILAEGGIAVLERESMRIEVAGAEVGVVGLKGFVGGFGDCQLPDFGEPLLREVYAETSADAAALGDGLREIVDCEVRIVLMHYSPSASTIAGEAPGIWAFLGSERLAAPLLEHRPHLVIHGHAHAGRFEGELAPGVPLYNVSAPLLPHGFHVFELPLAGGVEAVR
jgi:Icc-related predicted phosphoesterase